jgi:hypothetical protein
VLATTSGQVGFFDAAVLARPLPEGSFFALLAEHGAQIVRDEDFGGVLLAADGATVDPAVAAGQGVVVAVPHRVLG